jgi:hypothetical protein
MADVQQLKGKSNEVVCDGVSLRIPAADPRGVLAREELSY